ncbi:MAG: MBL fold metallo-hydrolase [Saprospiraceae bacterium]|nr:MBL fold metallo-hydrolase [Saprospiraceae bacterium]
MEITILGTGTSQGVPVIGCTCDVCLSADPKDKRLRCSIYIKNEEEAFVVDVGPDFRQQILREKINLMDAVLITHEHNDHVIGMDDLRPFNFMHKKDMPIYCTTQVQKQIKERFAYAFEYNPYPGAPRFKLKDLDPVKSLQLGSFSILPIPVFHGGLPVLGFRVADFTYITDANEIPDSSMELIEGTKTLVLNALHHRPHHSHFNLEQALAMVEKINPERTFLTHISHYMGKAEEINPSLPDNVQLAYDGQKISL